MTRVLVTGAAGNLGSKAVASLRQAPEVDVVGLDLKGVELSADLAEYGAWVAALAGVDVVLHLAAEPSPVARWESVLRSNIDASHNVLRAAEQHGVGRVVFASSTWVLAGYRFRRDSLTPSTPPLPTNPYGISKLMTERCGAAAVARGALSSFLSLRIGWCQPGENRPGPHMAFGRWGQEMWLSNDDWRQAVRLACTTHVDGFDVVNVMSDNVGSRWDLSETERVLGYRPLSHHTPRLSIRRRVREAGARGREIVRPFVDASGVGARW